MKQHLDINGIILAGGQSQRMGTPKAFLDYKGNPFIWHCIEALTPLVKKLYIVGDDPLLDTFGFPKLPDEVKGMGPVGGLYTGLLHSETNYNLVLSCDVPCVQTHLLQRLLNALKEDIDLIQFATEGRSHPLIALYHKRCVPHLKKELDHDERRLRKILAPLKTITIPVEGEEALQLMNINTRNEYKSLTHDIDR